MVPSLPGRGGGAGMERGVLRESLVLIEGKRWLGGGRERLKGGGCGREGGAPAIWQGNMGTITNGLC